MRVTSEQISLGLPSASSQGGAEIAFSQGGKSDFQELLETLRSNTGAEKKHRHIKNSETSLQEMLFPAGSPVVNIPAQPTQDLNPERADKISESLAKETANNSGITSDRRTNENISEKQNGSEVKAPEKQQEQAKVTATGDESRKEAKPTNEAVTERESKPEEKKQAVTDQLKFADKSEKADKNSGDLPANNLKAETKTENISEKPVVKTQEKGEVNTLSKTETQAADEARPRKTESLFENTSSHKENHKTAEKIGAQEGKTPLASLQKEALSSDQTEKKANDRKNVSRETNSTHSSSSTVAFHPSMKNNPVFRNITEKSLNGEILTENNPALRANKKSTQRDNMLFSFAESQSELKTGKSSRLKNILSTMEKRGISEEFEKMLKKAKLQIKNEGNASITTSLYPKELGKISLHLTLNDGMLSGRILVNNDAVQKEVQQNMERLVADLRGDGQNVSSFNVEVRSENNGESFQQNENTQSSQSIPSLTARTNSSVQAGENSGQGDLYA